MPVLTQRFKVTKFSEWKAAFDGNQAWRARMTFHNTRVFQMADDHEHVLVMTEVDDPQPFLSFMNSDEMKVKSKSSGHVGENEYFVVNEVPLYL